MPSPKIQTYQENVRAGGRGPGRVPLVDAPQPGKGSSYGLDKLSEGLGAAVNASVRAEEEDAKAWTADALSRTRLNWTERMLQKQSEFKPGPGATFTEPVLAEFDQYADEELSKAPNGSSRRFLQQRLAEFRADLGTKALVFEATARIDWRTDRFMGAAQNIAKNMNTDPTQYQTSLAEWLATVESSDMPPVKKSEIREKGMVLISKSVVAAQIQRSPAKFLDSIGFGVPQDVKTAGTRVRASSGELLGVTGNTAFDALPADTRMQMFETAIRARAQVDADADRATVAQRKLMAADASKNLWDLHFSGKLKLDDIQAQKHVLDENDYKALREAHNKGLQTMIDNPVAVAELTRLYERDPHEAKRYAYTAIQQGQLSSSTFRTEINRINEKIDGAMPKNEYQATRQWINGRLNPGDNNYDPVARARQTDAIRMYDDWVRANPKADDAKIRERGQQIIEQFQFLDFSQTVMALPVPRGTRISRNAALPELRKQVGMAGAKLKQDRDLKRLTQAEYEQELRVLRQWQQLVDKNQ